MAKKTKAADAAPNALQEAAGRTFDTMQNLISGLGGPQDKKMHGRFVKRTLTDADFIGMYEGDWIARKIADIPAFDMTREGREWKAEKEQTKLLENEEQRLGIDGKMFDTLANARTFGGCVLVLGLPGAPNTPAPEKITRGQLQFVHSVMHNEISAAGSSRILDIADPLYGEPQMWRVTGDERNRTGYEVHPSRVVRFLGARAPSRKRTDFWGNSIYQHTYDAINNAALTAEGVASLVPEAKVDVFKVAGLTQKVADPGYEARLTKRYALAGVLKSMVNAVVVDSEEEWEQKQISFSQLPELVRIYLGIVAGAADIPTPRMLGEAPGGLNATGDNDVRNYYDRIASEQKLFLKPQEFRLYEYLIQSALGSRPPEVWYEYRPLWQLSEKEQAEIFSKDATSFKSLADSRLVPLDALAKGVANKLSEDGYLPGIDEALLDAEQTPEEFALGEDEEEKMLAKEQAKAKAIVGAPPGQKALPAPKKKVPAKDAAPRTLYVRRNVMNGKEILKWAKAQGFESTLSAAELHVTLAFSREPVDWMKVEDDFSAYDGKGELIVPPGGARLVEKLGNEGAVVLLFASSRLSWRHEQIKRAGASWDYPEYQPHVTISYAAENVDLKAIEPYRGRIVLGPEIFEEVKGSED